jgi:hypothetical protein
LKSGVVKGSGNSHSADDLVQGQILRHVANAPAQFAVFFQRNECTLFFQESGVRPSEQRRGLGFQILKEGVPGKGKQRLFLLACQSRRNGILGRGSGRQRLVAGMGRTAKGYGSITDYP